MPTLQLKHRLLSLCAFLASATSIVHASHTHVEYTFENDANFGWDPIRIVDKSPYSIFNDRFRGHWLGDFRDEQVSLFLMDATEPGGEARVVDLSFEFATFSTLHPDQQFQIIAQGGVVYAGNIVQMNKDQRPHLRFVYQPPFECCGDVFIRFSQSGPLPVTWAIDNVVVDWAKTYTPGDINVDGSLTSADIDAIRAMNRTSIYERFIDMNGDGENNDADRRYWVKELKKSFFGDANLDRRFDSGDLVEVFAFGQYEDDKILNSNWSSGDWDGDGEFTTSDLTIAFQDGGYDQTAAVAVPEPAIPLLLVALTSANTLIFAARRRDRSV